MPCAKRQGKSRKRQAWWQRAFRRPCRMHLPTAMTATPIFSPGQQLLSRLRWGSRISDGTTEGGRMYVGVATTVSAHCFERLKF
jgi:hypothetical protein